MKDNRNIDKDHKFFKENSSKIATTKDVLKSVYVIENITIQELAKRYNLSVAYLQEMCKDEDWDGLRKEYHQKGLDKIREAQIKKAQIFMDLGNQLSTLKLLQLQNLTEEYTAYYARHGHLFKVGPTGELLRGMDGLPIPLSIPNVAGEIMKIKEAMIVAEGVSKLAASLPDGDNKKAIENKEDIIDVTDYSELLEQKKDK